MNRLSPAKQVAVISALVEGCSVRSTSRLTGVAKGTILSLLARVGTACARYQDVKKLKNHMHSVALFYMHYNFVRVHQTLRVTPAMEAGLTTTVWSIADIVALAESPKSVAA